MNSSQLINIVDVIRHSFCHLDPRLINHGERVSYILMKMLTDTSYYTKQEKQDIFMLGLLHDIGAYREDEIDSMLSFDMDDPMAHSVFGYLLFQNFSPLPEYADVILYHHHCNAQYYTVPVSNYHRDIARLIYLADRIDIFCVLNDAQELNTFLDTDNYAVFSDSNIRWFRNADEKYHILEHIRTGEYREELTEYIRSQITLSEPQVHDYLMMFIFSVDFRNEYTALHTSYAVHLSEQFADTLHLSSISGRTVQLAAILHNIGKISLSAHVTNVNDYDRYLKELYQNSTLDVTRKILKDAVDPQIIKIIDESFLLLEYWSEDRTVTFTPAPAAEIVALSYLISNILTHSSDFTYHAKLFVFLKKKYQSCHMDDAILLALEKYFQQIMEKTFASCSSVYRSYHHMMDEKHFLNNILLHYNSKYQ